MNKLSFDATGLESIDESRGILRGVSLISLGEVQGHECYSDQKTLQTVLAACKAAGRLKVKINHGQDVSTVVGVLQNFHISGDKVRGDLKLLKSSKYYEYILEMSRELSNHFGLSIAFKPSFETLGKKKFVRCSQIYSADIVDAPAANPAGLFDLGGISGLPPASTASSPSVSSINSANVSTVCATCAQSGEALSALKELHDSATAMIAEYRERMLRDAGNVAGLQDQLSQLRAKLDTQSMELEAKYANADLIACRKLGGMGFTDCKTLNLNPDPGGDILQALNSIKNPLERQAFYKEHKEAIFRAGQEEVNRRKSRTLDQ